MKNILALILFFGLLNQQSEAAASSCSLIGGGGGGGATWGSITGTLSSQTDLATALGLKAPLASPTFSGMIQNSDPGSPTTPAIQLGDPTENIGLYRIGNTPGGVAVASHGAVVAYLRSDFNYMQKIIYVDAGVNGTAMFQGNGPTQSAMLLGEDGDGTRGGYIKVGGRTAPQGEIVEIGSAGANGIKVDTTQQVYMPALATTSAAQTGTVCSGTAGKLTVDTTTTCLASTRKIKKNIELLDVGLGLVMKLKPVAYDLKEERAHEGRQVGLIAEEVAEVDKRLVANDEKGDPRAVRYQQLTAVLVKAVQEQQGQIADLRELVVEHDSELRTLRSEIYNLQSELRRIREE